MGFVGTLPYGEIIPVPQRPLTEGEARGLSLFVDRECAYCHQIEGRGGHRVGPDLSNILAKGRDVDFLVKFLKDPQAVSSTSIMPKYDLPEKDRRDLAEFILALDFRSYPLKILKRDEVPKLSAPGRTQPPPLRPGTRE